MKTKKHKARIFLCLLIMMSLFFDNSIPLLAATSYTTKVSNKNGVNGLIDYGSTTVDYIIPTANLQLVYHNAGSFVEGRENDGIATVVFQKKDSNGAWVTDPAPPFTYSRKDTGLDKYDETEGVHNSAGIYYKKAAGGEWGEDGKTFSNNRIKITFPKAAFCSDGTWHDVTLTISNIFFKADNGDTDDKFCFIKQTQYNSFGFSSERFLHSDPQTGASFDINVSVSGATSSQKLFLAFMDIDQPGFGSYEGNFPKGCVEGIRIKSGIFSGTQPHVPKDHVLRVVNGESPAYYATENTSGDDSWKAAISYIATANSTTFQWGGHTCATYFGLSLSDIPSFTVKTQVRTEQASSSVTGSKTYGSYYNVDSKQYLSLMSGTYSYTYSKTDLLNDYSLNTSTDDWIYNYSGKTVGDSGITANKTYSITIDRYRYRYSFNANPPAGKTASDVSNMPTDKTVVAAKEASGKSDATVNTPALTGYKFKGWNTSADGSGSAYPGAETMKSNKTFYAQWEPATYKVHFNANGSSNPNHETGESTQNTVTGIMGDQTLQFDVAANLNANQFAREGYTFAGWNTKADGTGTAYSDKQSVMNLISKDKTEITLYAQWTKKLGSETITVVSEETGNPVNGVSMKLQKLVNRTWTDVTSGTTNANGQISVSSLHWFNYRWVMTGVPTGYVKSADTGFTIHYNQLSASNQVILYMKHVSVILDSQVSDIIKGERAPAFLYHITGTDVAGVRHDYNLLVQTNVSSKFGTNRLSDLFAGTYSVTQTPVSRYCVENSIPVSNATANGVNATVYVLNYDSAEVKFPYTIREYGWHYGVNSKTNSLTK